VDSITYLDSESVIQTFAASSYHVDTDSEPGRVLPNPNSLWPIAQADRLNAVTITFKAGYGAAATDVPASLRRAVLILAGHEYDNRDAVTVGGMGAREIPLGVRDLAYQHRWGSYP